MKDNLYTGDEAVQKLVNGCRKVASAVSGTLGAAGYNAVLEHQFAPYNLTTNDGITIAKSINLVDPVENMGANLMKEIATRSDRVSGDGTTTSITLAMAILEEGIKVKANPMEIKRSLEECVPIIEESIKKQTREITVDEVGKVASISAEDEKIGDLIQEIYQKIGKDGILYTDVSKTFDDFYTIGSGIQVDGASLTSQYMADIVKSGEQMGLSNAASLKNPQILITKQKITSAKIELNSFMENLFLEHGVKELVIFCDDFEPLILQELLSPRDKGFRIVLIKMPVLWKDWWFEDIAQMTGSTIVDGAGLTLKALKPEHLGTCGSLIADKNATFLDGIKDVTDYMKNIESEGTDDAKIRAARLNTKTARLFIGAPTEQAFNYKRLKIEDARNCAWQALHSGIVAGGGVALTNCIKDLPNSIGGNILGIALRAPYYKIIENAGGEVQPSVQYSIDEIGKWGFDAKTRTYVNMFDAGIVDASNVTMTSVRNAISVASTVLSAKVCVVLPKKDKELQPDIPNV